MRVVFGPVVDDVFQLSHVGQQRTDLLRVGYLKVEAPSSGAVGMGAECHGSLFRIEVKKANFISRNIILQEYQALVQGIFHPEAAANPHSRAPEEISVVEFQLTTVLEGVG